MYLGNTFFKTVMRSCFYCALVNMLLLLPKKIFFSLFVSLFLSLILSLSALLHYIPITKRIGFVYLTLFVFLHDLAKFVNFHM